MSALTFTPTAEQQAIINAAETGGSLVIEAGAGTGKTATLNLIAEALAPKRGLYMAYNKAIQVEAASKFPSNVECRTAHSLAYRGFGAPMRHRLNGRKLSAKQYAAALGLTPFNFKRPNGEGDVLTPRQLAIMVKEAIGRFCNSDADEPTCRHIPYQGKDFPQQELCSHLLPYVKKAWADLTSRNGQLNFTHDCYLKMWSLSNPTLSYDFILFDEAQDANPAIAAVVEHQRAQTIMVGDSAQAIYGWRGAVDAMKNFNATHHLYLSQSFRFGAAVAEQANRWLGHCQTQLRIKGFDQIDSTVGALSNPDAILCRTNAGVIESALNYQQNGFKVAIAGGTKDVEMFVKAASELQNGTETNHPELAIYRDWTDVCSAVEQGEADDIGMMVRLVNAYGVSAILNICHNSSKPEDADITVSTAHKAKGLEWDRVQIHSDFKLPKSGDLSTTEAMLIYVAITRAKKHLDNLALAWLDELELDINTHLDEIEEER